MTRHAHTKSPQARRLRAQGYLPVSEAATLLGVSRYTLYRALRAGLVLGLDDGGALYTHWASACSRWEPLDAKTPVGLGRTEVPLPRGVRVLGRPARDIQAEIARLKQALAEQERVEALRQPV